MPSFTISQDQHTITVHTPEIELAFSREDGGLRALRHAGGPNLIGYGEPRPSVDICVGPTRQWMAERSFVRYLGYTVDEREGGIEAVVMIGIGSLKIYDRYRITGALIARRVSVENVGEDEARLWGVRLLLPWVRVGAAEMCFFEAPGNGVRPHVPLQVAAAERLGSPPRRFFALGLRDGRAVDPSPVDGLGLLALHAAESNEALLCWYYGAVEVAIPLVDGNGGALTLMHQVELADWLGAEIALSGGTQYILPLREAWPAALTSFQHTWPVCGLRDLPQPCAWVRDAAIYEVHPSAYGGFRGLAATLPALRARGFNTLCMLPVWSFANRKGRLWDENWQASGDLYAINDSSALDATLGADDDLRALIDTAHQEGMRVLVDLPLYGCAIDASIVAEQPTWFCYDEAGRIARVPGHPEIACFDWANSSLHEYIVGWALEQVRVFGFDGYRTVGLQSALPNWARRLPHHASAGRLGAAQLIERLRRELQAVRADVALLASQSGPVVVQNHDFTLDEPMHYMFLHMGLGRLTPAELGEWIDDYRRALPANTARVGFVESYKTRVINPLADGLRGSLISRLLLAGMVFCGLVPLIRAGQEQGDVAFTKRLLQLRERHAALRYGALLLNAVPSDSAQVFAVLRTHETGDLLGLLNVSPHRQTITLSLPVDTLALAEGDYALSELLDGSRWDEGGRTMWRRDELLALRLTLEPFAAYCFAVQPVEAERSEQEDQEDLDAADRSSRMVVVGDASGRKSALRGRAPAHEAS